MHAEAFLHKLLDGSIHKLRIKLLQIAVIALIKTKVLKLTALGRALDSQIQERSGIRKIDRLLGNLFFQKNYAQIYKAIIKAVVCSKKRIILIVDWTKLPNVGMHCLRAALAVEGRAITLYEEMHPKKKEGTHAVHKRFLRQLKALLPEGCEAIIVTDAGFKNPWFKEVSKLGWDYLGRVRGKTTYDSGRGYKPCEDLHRVATARAKSLGETYLSKKSPLLTNFYIVKQELKGRKKRRKDGKVSHHKDSKNYGRSRREPWLLVSSLKGDARAKEVVGLYKKRMTIEESFRDMKSSQYGFSMEENKTIKPKRLIVWLMLAALASLLAWVVGHAAEQMKIHYQFQANTIRCRRVLSFFYLGCQIIRKKLAIPIPLCFDLYRRIEG